MSTTKRFLTISDLERMPRPVWLIEGMFEVNSLVMLAGPSYSWKSFLAIDWMCCIATGRPWLGRAVVPSRVLYVLGEGKAALLKRIKAWVAHNNLTPAERALLEANFCVSFEVPQLAAKPSVDNMLAQLAAEGYAPNIICIDTFARSAVGLEENGQKDTGMWVEQADRLRQIGYTVLFLHHTKKNTEFGVTYRGSTAIMGAMDTAMILVRDMVANRAKLTIEKQKDHQEGKPLHFTSLPIFGIEENSDSMVLVPAVIMDERFSEEGKKADSVIAQLLAEPHDSDRARARLLSENMGISESAAQTRIRRYRKEFNILDTPTITLTDTPPLPADEPALHVREVEMMTESPESIESTESIEWG